MSASLQVPDGRLTDGVVLVRPWRRDDEEWVYRTCSGDREISRWTRVPWPYRRRDAREFILRAAEQWRAGTDAAFVITDAGDEERLGAVGILRIGGDPDGEQPPDEVGYWLAAHARGRGVATRAVRLVSDWALTELDRPAVVLQVDSGNDRSVGVAVRAGFRRVPSAHRGGDHGDEGLLAFRRDAPV